VDASSAAMISHSYSTVVVLFRIKIWTFVLPSVQPPLEISSDSPHQPPLCQCSGFPN
jgi:hypothetical protein